MKKLIYLLSIVLCASCAPSFVQIGKVNMIANRNINPLTPYKLLSTYSGGNKSEIETSKAKSIEEAINNTVKSVPGGEYVMNVKIYKVSSTYYAIEGDVWGVESNADYRGYRVGDRVTYKKSGKYEFGTILSFKTDVCLIKTDKDLVSELKFDEISKVDTKLQSSVEQRVITQKPIVGDNVVFTDEMLIDRYGVLTEIKDNRGIVKLENGKIKDVKFSKIRKVEVVQK